MTLPVVLGAGAIAVAAPAQAASPAAASVRVSATGTGQSCTSTAPCDLATGQARARTLAAKGKSVNVILAGGRYQLTSPWQITSADSGLGNAVVTYRAAPGATPVVTGASTVSGWAPSSLGNNIYEAATPTGLDTRQLYVNGQVAPRAQLAISPSAISLNPTGFTVNDPQLASLLDSVTAPSRVELETIASFTDRFAPAASISGSTVVMAQPAWNNNTYGYDVVQSPFRTPQFLLENAPQLLSAAGQWYIDPTAGRLYLRLAPGQDPSSLDVQLPTLQSVLQVSGSLASPVQNITFSGLTFTGTSWLHPSTPDGFAAQQTGAYMTGADPNRPADAFSSCQVGCPGFEATRGKWGMIAGGVQVSAASNITFAGNTFTNLGSQGLGIGNDGGANASGVDLGAQNITVTDNTFHQLSGGAVIAGGVQTDAHHPSDARMTNKNIVITDNTISSTGVDYKDSAGIFATYVDGLTVDHNDISDVPYTGIAVGDGWGAFDAGGSDEYAARGTYNYYPRYPANDPTIAQNYTVTNNYLHDVVTRMNDAGCIYTLGSVPGSLIDGNYCTDMGSSDLLYGWPIYLDEGSSNFTVSHNVFLDVPGGLHTNWSSSYSNHNLTADTNYLSANVAGCDIAKAPGSTCTNTIAVSEPNLPIQASTVIYSAGLTPPRPADATRPPLGAELTSSSATAQPGQSLTLNATLADLDPRFPVKNLTSAITAPAGWTVTSTSKTPRQIPVTGTLSPSWRITAPSPANAAGAQTITMTVTYSLNGVAFTSVRTVAVSILTPVTSLSTFTNASMTMSQVGSSYSITGSSGDTFDGFGIHSDSYGAIYEPAAASTSSTVTVRVASYDRPASGSKAGLVLRNSIAGPGSATGYVTIMVQGEGVTVFDDPDGNGYLNSYQPDHSSPNSGPIFLRLVRTGNQVVGSYSTDGTTWTPVGNPITLNTPNANLDAGMIYTTANPNASGTATFDSFKVANTTP